MADVRGGASFEANGVSYKLHVGMSVLADLQAKHGQDVLEKLDPPEGAGDNWTPDLNIVVDIVLSALARHHGDDADRWLVDDLLAENDDLIGELFKAAFPDQSGAKKPGKSRGPKAA